jgi:hypothetical protein
LSRKEFVIRNVDESKGTAGGLAGRAGRSSASDPKLLKELGRIFTQALEKQSKETSKVFESQIRKLIVELAKKSNVSISASDIDKLSKAVSRGSGKGIISPITKGVSSGSNRTSEDIGKSINKGLDKFSDNVSRELVKAFRELGIKLDRNAVKSQVSSVTRAAVPTNMEKSIKELTNSVNGIKTVFRDLQRTINSMRNLRTSDGKLDFSEFVKLAAEFKKLGHDTKELTAQSKTVSAELKKLLGESSAHYKMLNQTLRDIKSKATSEVSGARQRAKDDPTKFMREAITALEKSLKKSDKYENSTLKKAIDNFQKTGKNLDRVEKALGSFSGDLKSFIVSNNKKSEVKELIAAFAKFKTEISKIDVEFSVDSQKFPKGWKTYIEKMQAMANRVMNIKAKVDVVINDKDVQKALPDSVKMIIKPEKISKKQVQDAMPSEPVSFKAKPDVDEKPLKELEKKEVEVPVKPKFDIAKTEKEVRTSFKKLLDDIQINIEPGDTKALQRRAKEMSAIKDRLLKKIEAPELDLDKVFYALEELRTKIGVKYKSTIDGIQSQLDALEKRATDKAVKTRKVKVEVELDKSSVKRVQKDIHDTLMNQPSYRLREQIGSTMPQAADKARGERFFSKQVIKPFGREGQEGVITKATPAAISDMAKNIKMASDKNAIALSKSLKSLQKDIVTTLDKNFKEQNKKWEVVKPEGSTDPSRAFRLRPGNREWTAQIANVDRLKKLTNDFTSSADKLVSIYKKSQVDIRANRVSSTSKQAELIGKWLRQVPKENISSAVGSQDVVSVNKLSKIQEKYRGASGVSREMVNDIMKDFSQNSIKELFKKTYASAAVDKQMIEENLVKKLSLPAAQMGKTGEASFQTIHGSKRALPRFAKFNTGFERLYEDLEKQIVMSNEARDKSIKDLVSRRKGLDAKLKTFVDPQMTAEAKKEISEINQAINNLRSGEKNPATKLINEFGARIKGLGIRPDASRKSEANQLAKELFSSLASSMRANQASDEDIDKYIKSRYKEAIPGIAVGKRDRGLIARSATSEGERAKITKEYIDAQRAAIDNFEKIADAESINNFIMHMESMGVAADAVVKNLSEIKTFNVYDIMSKVLKGDGSKRAPLTRLAEEPEYARSVREYESAIRQLEGTLPLIEGNRPRRAYQQENVTKMMIRSGNMYGSVFDERLNPTEQKKIIVDLNMSIEDFMKRLKVEGKQLDDSISGFYSTGVPDSQAGTFTEFRPGARGGTEYLNALQSSVIQMHSENLTALAPFQQFQQAGRNISNITSAMSVDLERMEKMGIKNVIAPETPSLTSVRERALIESQRYGVSKYQDMPGGKFRETQPVGYGYNVTAELRATASTYEDQILIAGKLAKALTSASKILVKPAPAGRVGGSSEEEMKRSQTVTDMRELEGKILKAGQTYMQILGVDQKFEGRAEKALLDTIKPVISTVRGEDVAVQEAKITEAFLNFFGRKLTSRYGSKGVAVTPSGDTESLVNVLRQYSDIKDIKLDPSQTLGAAVSPKSIGKLASELFGGNVTDELKKDLVTSGNKFIIDLFHETGKDAIVSQRDADEASQAYIKFSEAWKKVFNEPAPEIGKAGIEAIKKKYVETFGEAELKEIKPIDVRVSSYGAAKRGLQTEYLEMIMGNVAGTGAGGSATMPKLSNAAYRKLLGREGQMGALSEYSAALGYTTATGVSADTEKEIAAVQQAIAEETYNKLKDSAKSGKSWKTFDEMGSFDYVGKELDKTQMEMVEAFSKAMRSAAIEASSNFYSEMVDELGEFRRGIIGPKFMSIVEEPVENPAWRLSDIKKGVKGEKINIPAMSAYATIFGEQSALVSEIKTSMDANARKHWEYLKALQTINEKDTEIYNQIMSGTKTKVDISKFRQFEGSTGSFSPEYTTDEMGNKVLDSRSFANTILDVQQFPQAFQLMMPTGRKTAEGEIEKKPFYVPGAQARVTYDEELIAGERGMDNITRRLTHLTNMAIELNEVLQDTEKYLGPQETQSKLKSIIGGYRKQAEELKNSSGPAAEASLEQIRSQLMGALSPTQSASPDLIGGTYAKLSELDFVNTRFQKDLSRGVSRKQALATNIGDIADVLIGKKSPSSPEQANAPTGLSRAAQYQGGLLDFGKKIGVDLEQELVDRRVTALQTAKVEYYNALAEAAVGKSGSVNELFFNKKLPAVIGKATVAVTDKSDSMSYFLEDLNNLEGDIIDALGSSHQGMFNDIVSKTKEVKKTHEDKLAKVRAAGLPVLQETQIGISSEFASRIPLDYRRARIQEVEGAGKKVQVDKEATPGTLASFLKDAERLRAAADSDSLEEKVEEYIAKTGGQYVESMRFPVTGTSSIAPYSAKLIEKGEFGDKALHSIIAPGVPEGMEEFKTVVNKVDTMIDMLSKRREQIHEDIDAQGGEPSMEALDEIKDLTNLINKLNNSISEVIPKYTAKAQKLDYDGDQIELHSAKTREARMEIGKHFQSFHSRSHDSVYDRAPSLEAAYRTKFLASAVEESTGKFVLGEGSQAYSKKFPTAGTFLKTPFLTEDMDYMKPEEILNALGGRGLGDLGTVMTDLIKNRVLSEKQFKSQEDMDNAYKKLSDLSEALKAIPEVNKNVFEDDKRYAKEIYEAVKASYNKDAVEVIDRVLKQKLYEEKSKDVTQAQIFKLNVGMDAESMYRLQRVAESNIGFGEGQETTPGKTPDFRASEYFKKRYPTGLKSLGGKEAEHFHTMVNEFVRVAQQKGMDVKHAGQLPIAGEIAKYMSRGPSGAEELIKLVQNDKSYEDYKDFNDVVEENIRRRAGAMLTSDIKEEIMGIMQSRGQDIDTMPEGRKQLIDMLVQKLNFEDFLRELALIVQKEAIEGLAAKASAWSPAKKARPGGGMSPVKGDIKDWAATEIKRQMEEGGIDIKSTFVEGKQGLSAMRTFGASTRAEYEKFREKYGDVSEPSGFLTSANVDDDMRKDYIQKYKRAYSTARNIQEEMTRFATEDAQGGAYSEMVRGTIEGLYKQYEELLVAVEEIQRASYDPSAAKDIDLFKRLSSTAPEAIGLEGIAPFVKEMINKTPVDAQRELKKYMDITGVPDLTDREKFDVAASLAKKLEKQGKDKGMSEEEITKYVDSQTEKALIIKQMDRIIDSAISKANDLRVLEAMMPSRNAPGIIDTKMTSREELAARQREQVKQMAASRRAEDFGGAGTTFPRDPGRMSMPTSGVVPVHIVGANKDVTINVRGLEGAAIKSPRGIAPTAVADSSTFKIYDDINKRKALIKASQSVDHEAGEFESMENLITGSQLHGGSPYLERKNKPSYRKQFNEENRYLDQVESLVERMDSKRQKDVDDLLTSYADWGTALHEIIQRRMKEHFEATGGVVELGEPRIDLGFEEFRSIDLEKYGYPGKTLAGYADVVERNAEGEVIKIADIKTKSLKDVKKFKQVIKAATGKDTNEVDLDVVYGSLSDHMKRVVEDHKSQINAYLEMFGAGEDAVGEIRLHARELKGQDVLDPVIIRFKKDPERFAKDLKAISEARHELSTRYGQSRFAKTGTGITQDSEYDERALNEIMDLAQQTIEDIKRSRRGYKPSNVGSGPTGTSSGITYHRDPEDDTPDAMERAYNENVRQAEQASFREQRETMDRFRGPQPIMEGETIEAFLANMTTLHDMSKDFQTNMEKVSADNLPKEIKDLLGQARREGKMPDKFIAALDKLKDKDEITYMQSIKAWKLYRMAVGDFLIDKAEEAKELSERLLDENDIRGSNQAYIDFRKRTDELQRFIKDASGKQSDIYTKDKKFIFPEMAQAAGVYRTSEQIAADNMGPLAEDEAATKKYEDIVKKLGAGKNVVPIEVAREVFKDFSELDENMAMILSDSEKLSRMEGLPDNFLDLNKLAERATRLREALQGVIKESGELDVVQKQNLETLVKYLKNMEALYAHKDFSAKASGVGTIPIPKFADEQMQRAIHGRNILAAQEYMRTSEMAGGPDIGEGFTYQEKVVGDTGEVVKNVMHHFRKYGETIDTTGQKVGAFTSEQQDLIEKMQSVNASFANATRRVVMWGAAATLIYGGVSQLKDALGKWLL